LKPGLVNGYEEEFEIIVKPEMFARFNDEVVHPLYSTVSLVHHMEWVSRKIILPFLEDHEEGMGAEVQVKHLSAAKKDTKVVLTARVINVNDRSVLTEIDVRCGKKQLAIGKVKQAILPKKLIRTFYE
jgi:fluoroacetyl-CoA thioesterase